MTKLPKGQRRNQFLMREASERADKIARDYLSTKLMHLEGVDDFDAAMGAIVQAMMSAYARGVSDALDTEDGRPLESIP